MRTITELELQEEDGHIYTRKHTCGECGGDLVVAWGGSFGIDDYVIRCGSNPHHEGFVPVTSERQDFESGMPLTPAVRAFHEAREVERFPMSSVGAISRSVAVLSVDGAGAILRQQYPQAPNDAILKAAIICRQYGLNPLRKHIFLLKFWNNKEQRNEWVDVLGIRAKRLMARRVQPYSYVDGPRIMTQAEQEAIRGEYQADRWWAITKLRGHDGSEVAGYGQWAKSEKPYGSDKGNSPQNMAMIRSESAALERLCPDEQPADIEVMDEQYIEAEAPQQPKVIERPSKAIKTATSKADADQAANDLFGDPPKPASPSPSTGGASTTPAARPVPAGGQPGKPAQAVLAKAEPASALPDAEWDGLPSAAHPAASPATAAFTCWGDVASWSSDYFQEQLSRPVASYEFFAWAAKHLGRKIGAWPSFGNPPEGYAQAVQAAREYVAAQKEG